MAWKKAKPSKTGSLSRKSKPVWDLYRDGITYSALSKFFVCRERFRLAYVEGWSEDSPRDALEFGNAFHFCLEQKLKGDSVERILRDLAGYERKRIQQFKRATPASVEEFHRLIAIVAVTFKHYCKRWEREDKRIKFVSAEQTFEVPIEVPSTRRIIKLRGRIDGVIQRDKNLWIMENKTKSNIDEVGLQQGLAQDMQTMLYAFVASKIHRQPIQGVYYNVIRRCGLSPRKGRGKSAVPESMTDFTRRVSADMEDRPEWYFMRWETELEKGDLNRWVDRTLYPSLIQIVKWWESVRDRPFDPWKMPDGSINDLHWQRPFGIFDSGTDGRRGDFFDLLTRRSTYGVSQRDMPFPELVEAS